MHIIKRIDKISSKSLCFPLLFARMLRNLAPQGGQVLIIVCCVIYPNIAGADLLVVTRKDTVISSLDVDQLSGLWLGKFSRIGNASLEVIDINEESPLRVTFYQGVLGMSDRQLKSYWAIRVFRGNGFPPRMVDNEAEVEKWVLERPDRIGYLSKPGNSSQLKVLFRLEEEENAEQ